MAGVPSVAGYPAGGSGGISKYTPILYAKSLLIKFYLKTVFGEIANRDYEGEITKSGDKVIVRTRPDVNVFDYEKGMNLREKRQKAPESPAVELLIDRAKAYSVAIDDIDKIQNDVDAMDEWAADGSEQLGIQIDRTILNEMWGSASANNIGSNAGKVSGFFNLGDHTVTDGTGAITITKANALDYIVYADSVLTESDVPLGDRFMVIPEWFKALINTSDLRSALFTGDQSNQNLRNGKMGMISNFTMYGSNNILGVTQGGYTNYPIIFGQKSALTFASQLIKNRTIDDPDSFATLLEGLHVFGFEVVKDAALGFIWGRPSFGG